MPNRPGSDTSGSCVAASGARFAVGEVVEVVRRPGPVAAGLVVCVEPALPQARTNHACTDAEMEVTYADTMEVTDVNPGVGEVLTGTVIARSFMVQGGVFVIRNKEVGGI